MRDELQRERRDVWSDDWTDAETPRPPRTSEQQQQKQRQQRREGLDIAAMARLNERLNQLHTGVAEAQKAGQQERVVHLMEETLGVLLQLEGPEGTEVLDLCEQLVKDYNSMGLKALESGDHGTAQELLKKAELLTDPANSLRARPAARAKLRGITLNNLGCYYKQRGKLHAALGYLEKTLKMEEAAGLGSKDNPASTHLNIAVILSNLGRHAAAVDYATQATEILMRELGIQEADIGAEVDALLESRPSSSALASRLSTLAVAFYNQAVEMEHLHRGRGALSAYTNASLLAERSAGADSGMAATMRKALATFSEKHQHSLSRFASGRKETRSNAMLRPDSAPVRRVPSLQTGRIRLESSGFSGVFIAAMCALLTSLCTTLLPSVFRYSHATLPPIALNSVLDAHARLAPRRLSHC
uniref:Uncharacterized protein n=1 Tax=Tetraselmis sp. GSL018 TaxID=582737 RepID=A0A061QT34_9CHLO